MADQFSEWDRFQRHLAETKDVRKALRWTRHERQVEAKRLQRFKHQADLAATASAAKAILKEIEKQREEKKKLKEG